MLIDIIGLGALIAVICFTTWLTFKALRDGVWNARGVLVHRDKRPVLYWLSIGFMMFLILAWLCLLLLFLMPTSVLMHFRV